MALIVWDIRLETGHPQIDEQHKSIIEIFNRLHGAMKQGKGKAEMEGILLFLQDYIVRHFAMEEELMAQHHYSREEKHKELHANLVRQVAGFGVRFQQSTATLTLPMMNFLEDWVGKHIQEDDQHIAAELKGKVT